MHKNKFNILNCFIIDMDRNALDWLFSTAPQTIAAFVGLIFAGVCFIIGKIDDRVEKDSTLL